MSDSATDAKKLIVHYHMARTEESSVAGALQKFSGEGFVNLDRHPDYGSQRPFNRTFFEAVVDKEPHAFCFSANRIVPDIHLSRHLDVFPIVFVRHPLLHAIAVHRAVSTRKTDWPGKELIAGFDAAQWIDWCLSTEQRHCKNFQSCLLSIDDNGHVLPPRGRNGRLDTPAFHALKTDAAPKDAPVAPRRGRLLLVFERLDAAPVVGVTEHNDKSLHLLNEAGESRFPGFKLTGRRKSSEASTDWRSDLRAAERSLPVDTLQRFYEMNEDDLLLWERYAARVSIAKPLADPQPGRTISSKRKPARSATASTRRQERAGRLGRKAHQTQGSSDALAALTEEVSRKT